MMTKSWRMVWRMESRWGNIIGGCCKTCLRLLVQQVIWGQGHVRWWWADLTDWRNLITFFFIRLLLTCFNSILICGCVHFFGDRGSRSAGRLVLTLHLRSLSVFGNIF